MVVKDKNNEALMVIEYQEDSSNHNNSANDKYKEYIINSKGLAIIYIDEKLMVEGNSDYECSVYLDIIDKCRKILIAKSEKYRNENILLEVEILSKKKITAFENKLNILDKNTDEFKIIQSEIKKLKKLIKDNTETLEQIKVLYNYKIEVYNNPDEDIYLEYNIPLAVVIKNLDLDIDIYEIGNNNNEKNDDIIQIEKLIKRFSNKIDGEYRFSYDSLNELLVAINIEEIYDLKMHFIRILIFTQKIYEYYIKIIEDYKDSIINKLLLDNSKIKDDIEKKCEKKYEKNIERRDNKIKKKDIEIYNLKKEVLKLQKVIQI